jgi:hypothetical protein
MLVVMLILLTATAMAAVSLQTTQYELRAAGYNRAATQTQYVSEAAASTSLAWVDGAAMDSILLVHLKAWDKQLAPALLPFGEPQAASTYRKYSSRTQWIQQMSMWTPVMPPLTQAGTGNDLVGTLGPRSSYAAGVYDKQNGSTDYVVDMYDCRPLMNTATAGTQVNQGGSGKMQTMQLYCVYTSRGRNYLPGSPKKTWTMAQGTYEVNRFTLAHDSRGTFVTPPMNVP